MNSSVPNGTEYNRKIRVSYWLPVDGAYLENVGDSLLHTSTINYALHLQGQDVLRSVASISDIWSSALSCTILSKGLIRPSPYGMISRPTR